jgi:Domain of unknown function (DUF4115)
MRRRGADLLFAVLVTAVVGLGVLAGLVWSGVFVDDQSSAPVTHPTPRPRPAVPPRSRPQTVTQRTTTAVSEPARPQPVRVVIAATRGRCWVAAHRGSATGPVLLARTLDQGEKVTLSSRKMVVELGASSNVDLTVNGKPRAIPSGAASITLGSP